MAYTREELSNWINKQPEFFKLYKIWLESNMKASLRPTLCRKDSQKDFTLDNLDITVNKHSKYVLNKIKMKPVGQFTASGIFIARYDSIALAAHTLKGSISHLWKSLQDKNKTYRGFYWRYL